MNRSFTKIRHIQESNSRLEKRFLNENAPATPIGPTTQTTVAADPKTDFVNQFKGQALNFYLPDVNYKNVPLISSFMVTNVTFPDSNSILIEGTSSVGTIEIKYSCDGTDTFLITKIVKFDQRVLDDVAQFLDLGLDNNWKKLLASYAKMTTQKQQLRPMALKQEQSKIYHTLLKSFPNMVLNGGSDQTGQTFIKYIQNYLCGTNASGKAVAKAKFQ
jgi:hypothetical protein